MRILAAAAVGVVTANVVVRVFVDVDKVVSVCMLNGMVMVMDAVK